MVGFVPKEGGNKNQDSKEYFEDSPEREQSVLEKGMELGDKDSCLKTGSEDPVLDGANSVLEEPKEREGMSGLPGNVKEVNVELEEELGKVSLIGDSSPVIGHEVGKKNELGDVNEGVAKDNMVCGLSTDVVGVDVVKSGGLELGNVGLDESDRESESEDESSSSMSSSSSGDDTSSDEDDKDGDKEEEKGEKIVGVTSSDDEESSEEESEKEIVCGTALNVEHEEEDADNMVEWSDAELEDGEITDARKRLAKKNDLEALPPVPAVDVTLEPHHEMLPVGAVLSMMGPKVIVEGMEKHNPLSEGSILWITEKRSPLGIVDEIFGPVKSPYYVVRYNSENEIPLGIDNGTMVSFVPEFANHVLANKDLYKKGYDAGENEEEAEELEFSDDEKEAEYYRMLKASKRGSDDQTRGQKRNNKKKGKNWEGNWKISRPSGPASMDAGQLPPNQNLHNASGLGASTNHDSGSSSYGAGQDFTGRAVVVPTFPPPLPHAPSAFIPPNGFWMSGPPPGFQGALSQPQSGLGAFSANNMPWPGQNQISQPYPLPMPNPMLVQQQFNPNPSHEAPPSTLLPAGQPNFYPGLACPPWPAIVGQNFFNQNMGFQVQPSPGAMDAMNMGGQGLMPNGPYPEQNSNFQPPDMAAGNIQSDQQFNRGASPHHGGRPFHRSGRGRGTRGRGRRH